MGKYTIKQLRDMSAKELNGNLKELQNELRSLRFQVGLSELKEVHKIREIRKTIAQIKGLLNTMNYVN